MGLATEIVLPDVPVGSPTVTSAVRFQVDESGCVIVVSRPWVP